MKTLHPFDLIVIGSGAAGMIAAITAARGDKKVLLLEKLSRIGTKLKATGGGRCNLTNTLDNESFMEKFGREGRFMTTALEALDQQKLRHFFTQIGVESHAPDGFRVFPISHNAMTIIGALEEEMKRLGVQIECNQRAENLIVYEGKIAGVRTQDSHFEATCVILATGGLGYPLLGAEGDGYRLSSAVGHRITPLHPAMMPLITREKWVAECRGDTIAKVTLRVDLKNAKHLRAVGDLIFTKEGIRGPVVLDFAREVTPLLSRYGEVPLLLNLTKGMHEESIRAHLKSLAIQHPEHSTLTHVCTLLPKTLSRELCLLCEIDPLTRFSALTGLQRDRLIKILAWTPLTVIDHEGFKLAMITRGGVALGEIDPRTMQSRLVKGLYFCGEVMDLDGPCGGYNLQWSFASGYLAGKLKPISNNNTL